MTRTGLAQLARTGWYKRVHVKASATHIDRAALLIRAQLIIARTSMANQLRGLLKLFGLRMRPGAGSIDQRIARRRKLSFIVSSSEDTPVPR